MPLNGTYRYSGFTQINTAMKRKNHSRRLLVAKSDSQNFIPSENFIDAASGGGGSPALHTNAGFPPLCIPAEAGLDLDERSGHKTSGIKMIQ